MRKQLSKSKSSVFLPQWCFFAAHLVGAALVVGSVSGCGLPDDAILDPYLSCEAPQILGHRGTRKAAPENTLPAFRWAMENGADGVELDVKRTRDNVLVAFHDESTGRTTNDADDRSVADLHFGQLRLLDAGGWFSDDFRNTKIPTLQQSIDILPAHATIDIDHLTPGDVEPVAAFIERNGIAARTLVSSYDEHALGLAAQRMPDVKRVLFLGDVTLEELPDELERQAAIAFPDIVRVPKGIQEDPRSLLAVLEAGFEPATAGTKIQWVGGIVYADNAFATRERRDDRRPVWCEAQ